MQIRKNSAHFDFVKGNFKPALSDSSERYGGSSRLCHNVGGFHPYGVLSGRSIHKTALLFTQNSLLLHHLYVYFCCLLATSVLFFYVINTKNTIKNNKFFPKNKSSPVVTLHLIFFTSASTSYFLDIIFPLFLIFCT